MNRRAVLFLGVLVTWQMSLAQMQAPALEGACPLPEVMQLWLKPPASRPVVWERADRNPAGQVQQPYRVRLQPCAADWCKPASFAAMVKIDITQSGRYRVAVDQMLWIDVYDQREKIEGVLCEHSGCQPIRKMVQFDLNAGPHWVALESRTPVVADLLVAPVTQR